MDNVAAVSHVLKALNELGINSMLVGALATNLYAEPRATLDADVVVDLDEKPISLLIPKLGPGLRLDTELGFKTITGRTRYKSF